MEQGGSSAAAVLIVDDNPLITNVLKSLLQSESYQVYVANNGEEAWQLLGAKQIDLIVCDVMMPRMDGYELHHRVREQAELSHIPFVFLTALDSNDEIKRGREIGADEYLIKPFDPATMLSLVKGKVKRSRDLKHLSEQQFDAYRRRVIHTLSHEFRTPLVAINTGAEILIDQKKHLDTSKITNLIEAIRRGGLRLEKLVTDFMLLQQIEAGISERMFKQKGRKLDLVECVGRYVEMKQPDLKEQGCNLVFHSHVKSVECYVYEPQLMDILSRLVDNAMKFSPNDRTIEIYIVPLESLVAIEVRDRGMGLDMTRVKEAIDVFGQLDRDRIEQQGGGLGLAIANRYAKIHGGKLDFEERDGGGSTISFVLPVAESAAELPGENDSKQQSED